MPSFVARGVPAPSELASGAAALSEGEVGKVCNEAGFVHLGQTCYFEVKGRSYMVGEDVEGVVTR